MTKNYTTLFPTTFYTASANAKAMWGDLPLYTALPNIQEVSCLKSANDLVIGDLLCALLFGEYLVVLYEPLDVSSQIWVWSIKEGL